MKTNTLLHALIYREIFLKYYKQKNNSLNTKANILRHRKTQKIHKDINKTTHSYTKKFSSTIHLH